MAASKQADMMSVPTVPDLFSVKDMVVVVTGGGTGIGLMMAKTLENNGAIVYIASRKLDVLEQAARENNRFGNLHPIQCDISSQASLRTLVDTIRTRHGYLDVLINNAGISPNMLPNPLPTPSTGTIDDFSNALLSGTEQEFASGFAVNCTAAYYASVLFLPLLDEGNRRRRAAKSESASVNGNGNGLANGKAREANPTSHIITVASGGGFRKDDRVFSVSYTLSKAAAIHLGKLLAGFLKDWQIRSNVVCPGFFPSVMTADLITDDALQRGVPLHRAGTIDDIAGLTLFLASKAGAYVNGTVQLIDGGRLLLFPSTY